VFVARSYNGSRARRQAVTNVDHRIKTAIKAANRTLTALGIEPTSERVTPHSLRRTYASLRAAAGDHPVYIAEQLGHTDPGFTFRVYQRACKRRDRLDGAYLAQFDRALEWALMDTGGLGQHPTVTARNGSAVRGNRAVER
jgi:integrase